MKYKQRRQRAATENRDAAPDAASLHKAALDHLARYATTRASLIAVLDRRIRRWSDPAAQTGDPEAIAATAKNLRQTARAVVARLADAGLVDDRAFANGRARRLVRAGRSRSAVLAHLVAKGVDRSLAEESFPADEDTELLAGLAFARRRRCGPFGPAPASEADAAAEARALAAFGRAGFRHEVARRVLTMTADDARERLEAARADRSR